MVPPSARSRSHITLAIIAGASLLLASCTAGKHHAAGSAEAHSAAGGSRAAISVTGGPGTGQIKTADTGRTSDPSPRLRFLTHIYSLSPSGPLASPATVTMALPTAASADEQVIVATRESTRQPWTYLPATLTPDRTAVTFTTSHFSLFGVLGYDLGQVISTFKSDFLDTLDGGMTQTINPPHCDNEKAARADGYSITSSSGDTVYWCFGVDAGGTRVLQVTDHRRYPLEVSHPNMAVLSDTHPWGQLSSLSQFDVGSRAVIAPGATGTFNADLAPGSSEGIGTEIDGLGQSLYALQVGVETLVQILTTFGTTAGKTALQLTSVLLQSKSCIAAFKNGAHSGDVIAGCFDAKTLIKTLGVKALLIVPLMLAGPVIAFFHSQWNAIVDQFNGHDKYQILIKRAAVPATIVSSLAPVTASGVPAPGYTVRNAVDPGDPIDCSYPSPSYSAVSPNIYYCAPSAALSDACWKSATPGQMLCLTDPSRTVLTAYAAQGDPGPVQPVANPQAFRLDLADGEHCRARDGGSWSTAPDQPSWVGWFSCAGENAIWAVPNDPGNGVDRSKPTWTVWLAPFDGHLKKVAVTRAYFLTTSP